MKNKTIALIPARLHATRFPGKLLKILDGKTIIRRTWEAVMQTGLFDQVIVVCDHQSLINEIEQHGGKAMMSNKDHESGTDRIAEAANHIEADIIVNVQGDEPFITKEALQKVTALFDHDEVQVASLMMAVSDTKKIQDPNCVKVVTDAKGRALYFSRAPIPYNRDASANALAYQHIGVYAFRKEVLMKFTELPVSRLEHIERLENLRMLENNIPIHLAEISCTGISIDTPEDFMEAETYLLGR